MKNYSALIQEIEDIKKLNRENLQKNSQMEEKIDLILKEIQELKAKKK